MENDYGVIDISGTPAAYETPVMQTGFYTHVSEFGEKTQFHFRRMPRAQRFPGRFGVFAYDPDAHWILIAVMDRYTENNFKDVSVGESGKYYRMWITNSPTSPNWIVDKWVCAWCGRSSFVGELIHPKCVDKAAQ